MGNQERAEEFLRQALAIRKKDRGPTHPDTAESLSNRADLLSHQHVIVSETCNSDFDKAAIIQIAIVM